MSPIGGYCCKSRFGVANESLRAVDAFCAPRRRLRISQNVLQRSVDSPHLTDVTVVVMNVRF